MKFSIRSFKRLAIVFLTLVSVLTTSTVSGNGWRGKTEMPAGVPPLGETLPPPDEKTQDQIRESYAGLPLSFEANRGQADDRVKFLSRGDGYSLFLTDAEAVLRLRSRRSTARGRQTAVLRMRLAGANPGPKAVAMDELPGRSNYIIGNDRAQWRTNIPNYARVKYAGVYPGIDLVYYGNQRRLEYDFVVAAGADPDVIEVGFEGALKIALDRSGDLLIHTPGGKLVQQAPVVYQEAGGGRQIIRARYRLKGKNRVGFEIGSYDRSRALTIDPILSYSTYLGGGTPPDPLRENIGDSANGIAIDGSGNAYIVGETDTSDFPVTDDVFQEEKKNDICDVSTPNILPCGDVFVAKLNSTGTELVYATYIGSKHDDAGFGIAVTPDGLACITGGTDPFHVFGVTEAWPLTNNSYQGNTAFDSRGLSDAFATVFNATGTDLIYSTYYGGKENDIGHAIAVDSTGKVYITGETGSENLDMKNAFQAEKSGGKDAFVAKFDPLERRDRDTLLYATYLGGRDDDIAKGIDVDTSGNAYIAGLTHSSDFPTEGGSEGFFQGDQGGLDAFVAKINPSASGNASLVYSTYLGGSGTDRALAIAIDAANNAYVTGSTNSSSATFPIRNGFDTTVAGVDVFITKFNSDGSNILYSTYLGGTGFDEGRGIAVDSAGLAYVTGMTTNSSTFPKVNQIPDLRLGGQEAFVARIGSSGDRISFSTLLGGFNDDAGNGIAVGGRGATYVAGQTFSQDFPVTSNAAQDARKGHNDGFVTKLLPTIDLDLDITDNADPVAVGSNVTYTFTITNLGEDIATGIALNIAWNTGAPATFVSASFGCTNVNSTGVICELPGEIVPNGVLLATLTLNARSAGTVRVAAAASANETDSGPNSSFDIENTLVQNNNQTADLSVSLNDNPDPVTVGQNLTYAITVTNNGPNAASNVTVSDTLPANTTFQSVSSAGSCSTPPVGGTGTVSCTFASLASGASQTVTLVVNVGAGAGATITNTVTAASATPDPNGANNSATVTTAVNQNNQTADLSIVMDDSPDPVAPAGNLVYTITVTNNGPAAASNVTVTDQIPAGTTFSQALSNGNCNFAAGTLTCTFASIAAGASQTITLTVKVNATGGTLSNTATVASATTDPNSNNNSATTVTTVQ